MYASAQGGGGFINRRGELVIKVPDGSGMTPFSEGLAAVSEAGRVKFIDARGRRAFGRTFNHCESFGEGPAAVAVETEGGEKWGYIDRRGQFVIEPQFDEAHPFDGALALVAVSEGARATAECFSKMRPGYIDRTGRYVWRKR